jgi:hypothetical protein
MIGKFKVAIGGACEEFAPVSSRLQPRHVDALNRASLALSFQLGRVVPKWSKPSSARVTRHTETASVDFVLTDPPYVAAPARRGQDRIKGGR